MGGKHGKSHQSGSKISANKAHYILQKYHAVCCNILPFPMRYTNPNQIRLKQCRRHAVTLSSGTQMNFLFIFRAIVQFEETGISWKSTHWKVSSKAGWGWGGDDMPLQKLLFAMMPWGKLSTWSLWGNSPAKGNCVYQFCNPESTRNWSKQEWGPEEWIFPLIKSY